MGSSGVDRLGEKTYLRDTGRSKASESKSLHRGEYKP